MDSTSIVMNKLYRECSKLDSALARFNDQEVQRLRQDVDYNNRAPLKIHFFEVKIRFIEFCSINA